MSEPNTDMEALTPQTRQTQKTPESSKNDQEDRSELKQPGDKLPRFDETATFEELETTITAFGRTKTLKPVVLQ